MTVLTNNESAPTVVPAESVGDSAGGRSWPHSQANRLHASTTNESSGMFLSPPRRYRWIRLVGGCMVLLGGVFGVVWAQGPGQPAADDSPATPAVPQVIQAREGRDVAGSGDLIGFSHVDDRGTQVITLVNTRKLWMAVYHISSEGEIRLTSSRPIDADFTLQLNVTDPLPEHIRELQPAKPPTR